MNTEPAPMTLKEADSVFLRLARLRIHVQALV